MMFRFVANRTDGAAATDDGESWLCGQRRRKVSLTWRWAANRWKGGDGERLAKL